MLRCADNTIYSGYAVDPIARLEKHNSGKGAKYTRARRPVKLVYFEKFENKGDALRREIEFKKLSRAEKEKMIENFKL
jgi:putative endonuclease